MGLPGVISPLQFCLWAERKNMESYGSCRIFRKFLWSKSQTNYSNCWFISSCWLSLLLTTGKPILSLSSWEQTYHLPFGTLKDDVPFPKVGCVILPWRVYNMYILQQPWKTNWPLPNTSNIYVYTLFVWEAFGESANETMDPAVFVG